ncbi:outer membrane beta-barrel protein [Ponticaulis sp.]|uniref:outer membrane beta-barrel protein n=1 Tax=Ponticaulis sp. TaxID=2020902 RepID=UPI000B73B29A|nr:outer membrane beta-barrel protein [Ponticaulis sp.]MAI90619.1 hypothetical protein [Ponticaulis sp.]OUX99132.1 MAG: hypothetical protein CBB65_09280 [Hyphomonadaceae bacterium TMED5]|tara:strand:- start:84178 stop:85095 length:918 start_codon:yes stop_codon:yes gene_type:complete
MIFALKPAPAGAALILAFTSLPVMADEPVSFSGEASIGASYDSDVGIADLDQSTGEGDYALLLGLEGNAEFKPTSRLTLRAGYELADTQYQDYDEFSLQTHRGSLEAAFDFDVVEAGLLYNYVHARLDGDGYLDYHLASPYVTRLIGDTLFLRGALEFTDKDFLNDDLRDAEGQGLRGDAYYFIGGTDRYVSLTAKLEEEDAMSDAFDFSGGELNANYSHRSQIMDRDTRFQIGAGWETRDYDGITPAISETREDDIISADAGFEFELAGPLLLDLDYSYRDRQSNLPSADYDEHVGEIRLRAQF